MISKLLLTSWVFFPLLALPITGCATNYSADSIEGWVVDAENQKPLEGVVVVANWPVKGGFHGELLQQLKILEAVTDGKGRYFLPSWGPISVTYGRVEYEAPGLWLFKYGYIPVPLSNRTKPSSDRLQSEYNQKTVRMQRFGGELKQYAEILLQLNGDLLTIGYRTNAPCNWRNFPATLRALDALEKKYREYGLRNGTVVSTLRGLRPQMVSAGCGDFDDLFVN